MNERRFSQCPQFTVCPNCGDCHEADAEEAHQMIDVTEHLRKGLPCQPNVCRFMDARSGCTCAEAADEIDRLRATLAAAQAGGVEWRPIETAPKDGTWILVWEPDGVNTKWSPQEVARWRTTGRQSNTPGWYDSRICSVRPTLWQPLPAAPCDTDIEAFIIRAAIP